MAERSTPSVPEDQGDLLHGTAGGEDGAPVPSGSSESSTSDMTLEAHCDEDLKELIEWLNSTDPTPSEEVTMAFAQALKQLIFAMSARLQDELRYLIERANGYSKVWKPSSSKRSEHKLSHMLYLKPYFRDERRFIPLPNDDTVKRRKMGLPKMLVNPAMKWSDEEIVLLTNAVKESLSVAMLEILNEEYYREMEKLNILQSSCGRRQEETSIESTEQRVEELRKRTEDVEWQAEKLNEMFNDPACLSAVEWDRVAESVQNGQSKRYPNERSDQECRSAWLYAYAPWINRGDWSEKEVADLLSIAEEHKFRNWIDVAQKLGTGRTAFDCCKKYVQERGGSGQGGAWSREEDKKLLELVAVYSKGDHVLWRPVAFAFDNRTATQCRQRYEALHVRRGQWTEEEDRLLLKAVKQYGKKSWVAIAAHVPNRSSIQCRARYVDVLDKCVRLTSWTEVEDEILKLGHETFGRCWTKISNLLVGRTGNQVKMRFRALEKIEQKLYSRSYEQQLLAKERAGKVKRELRAAMRREMFSESSEEEGGEVPSLSSLQDFLNTLNAQERKAIEVGLTIIGNKYRDGRGSQAATSISRNDTLVEQPKRKRRRKRRVRKDWEE